MPCEIGQTEFCVFTDTVWGCCSRRQGQARGNDKDMSMPNTQTSHLLVRVVMRECTS